MIYVTYDSNKKKDNITVWDDSTGFKSTYSWDANKYPTYGLIMSKYVEFMNREDFKLNIIRDLNKVIDSFLIDPLYTDNFNDDCSLK